MRRDIGPTPAVKPFAERALWFLAATTVIVIPLVIDPYGEERFRLPKEIALRASGLLILTSGVLGVLWSSWRPALRLRDRAVLLAVIAVVWTLIAAGLSTNRFLSAFTALRVASLASFFLTSYLLARKKSFSTILWILLTPAIANAALSISQELNIWNPFGFDTEFPHHYKSTALIGNVNDVGAYLMAPALAAIVAVIVAPSIRRVLVPSTVILVLALVLNQTLTSFVAFAAGLFALGMIAMRGRQRLIAAAVVACAVLATFVLSPPLRTRTNVIVKAFREGRYDDVVTGRFPAYSAAIAMVERSPLTGVGPGTYGFHYYFSRLRMEQRYPFLLTSNTRMQNFGEAHNDHLQIAAEAGIPAFVLLLAGLAHLASLTLRGSADPDTDVRARFARLLSLPLSVSLFVLMLAQFPLQLAAPTVTILFLIAVCATWTKPDAQSA